MTAAVKIYELSASMTGTDKTSGTVRFKLANDDDVNSANPITIPASGKTMSFTKQLRMYCATAPDTKIDNFRAYPDAANNFGASVEVVASVIDDYHTATLTELSASDLWDFSSGHPMDMDEFHATYCATTGYFGDILKLQMKVGASASSGTLSAEDLTFAYLIAPVLSNLYSKLCEFGRNLNSYEHGNTEPSNCRNAFEGVTTKEQAKSIDMLKFFTSAEHPFGMMI